MMVIILNILCIVTSNVHVECHITLNATKIG